MANHAWVVPRKGRMPTRKETDHFVRSFMFKRFPQLKLRVDATQWSFEHPENRNVSILCWYSKYRDKRPAIEFRHQNVGAFGWWVERELRNAMAREWSGVMFDEADNKAIRPTNSFRNFKSYYKKHWQPFRARLPKELQDGLWKDELSCVPEDMKELIGKLR